MSPVALSQTRKACRPRAGLCDDRSSTVGMLSSQPATRAPETTEREPLSRAGEQHISPPPHARRPTSGTHRAHSVRPNSRSCRELERRRAEAACQTGPVPSRTAARNPGLTVWDQGIGVVKVECPPNGNGERQDTQRRYSEQAAPQFERRHDLKRVGDSAARSYCRTPDHSRPHP